MPLFCNNNVVDFILRVLKLTLKLCKEHKVYGANVNTFFENPNMQLLKYVIAV